MRDPRIGRAGRRFRRAQRLRHHPRGVAAVVGTLLSLLVFFALFGIFLTQYLPVWMADNESEFTAQADASLALFKSNVDAQAALGGPAVYATSFPLSSQGVPLLAQPTQGTLVLLPPSCNGGFYSINGTPVQKTSCVFERQAFTAGAAAKTNNPWNRTATTADLEFQLPNRYFNAQTFYFENDAVIQAQGVAHATIVGPPPLTVTKTGANITVATTFVGLYGNSTVVTGQGSEEVYSALVTTTHSNSRGLFLAANGSAVLFNYTFQIGTRNLCAWYYYFTNLTSASGLTAAQYSLTDSAGSLTTSVCADTGGLTYLLTFKVLNIAYATAVTSSIDVSLGAGVA